eukprot:3524288-Pyramimonas_sp.AAC.1
MERAGTRGSHQVRRPEGMPFHQGRQPAPVDCDSARGRRERLWPPSDQATKERGNLWVHPGRQGDSDLRPWASGA